MNVKISVIIVTYNRSKLLANAVNSVINQKNFNLSDVEIIIINNNSTDNTTDVIEQLIKSHTNIHVHNFTKQSSVGYCKNYGIKQSTGDYITLLDDDDTLSNEFLNETYKYAFKLEPSADCVKSQTHIVKEEGVQVRSYKSPPVMKGKETIEILKSWNIINGMLIKRSLYKNNPELYFSELPYQGEDIHPTFVLSVKANSIIYCPTASYNYIKHGENITAQYNVDHVVKRFYGNNYHSWYVVKILHKYIEDGVIKKSDAHHYNTLVRYTKNHTNKNLRQAEQTYMQFIDNINDSLEAARVGKPWKIKTHSKNTLEKIRKYSAIGIKILKYNDCYLISLVVLEKSILTYKKQRKAKV